jgi:disulfide oxidoreductase YuzD
MKAASTPDEITAATIRRRKPMCQQQIEQYYNTIKNNTTIMHPRNESIMYLAEDLHHRAHGSVAAGDVLSHEIIFDTLWIPNDIISPPTATNTQSLETKNSITVAYSNNQHIQKLNKNLVGGLDWLHHDLTTNLLKCTGTDPTRSTGKVDHSLPSQTVRLRFGYGRVQKPSPSKVNWTVHTWNYRGLHMPTIKYKPFTSLPNSLQKQLITVFEAGHIFAETHYNHPFSNELRTQIFSKRMNRLLGYPNARFKFEYIDIVLTMNTKLRKHIDGKNDHREGYNICVVYSYYCTMNDLEYKVSIIMCTRNDVGVAFDRACKGHNQK